MFGQHLICELMSVAESIVCTGDDDHHRYLRKHDYLISACAGHEISRIRTAGSLKRFQPPEVAVCGFGIDLYM